jgi:hypothetical protein
MEKVSGDWRGILPGGMSVLVEVKTVERLMYSEFADHQVDALNKHHAAGGLSLIGWVCGSENFVLRWPVPSFVPRTSLAIETARQLDVKGVRQ